MQCSYRQVSLDSEVGWRKWEYRQYLIVAVVLVPVAVAVDRSNWHRMIRTTGVMLRQYLVVTHHTNPHENVFWLLQAYSLLIKTITDGSAAQNKYHRTWCNPKLLLLFSYLLLLRLLFLFIQLSPVLHFSGLLEITEKIVYTLGVSRLVSYTSHIKIAEWIGEPNSSKTLNR